MSHEKIYGLAATIAVLDARPDDILRVAHTRDVRREVAPLLREAARRRVAYEEREPSDLERIAGSIHHEGVCIAARPRPVMGRRDFFAAMERRGATAVCLDGVTNPHNLGAIVRSAAFLGVEALIVEAADDHAPLSPAAVRVAQGGAEHIGIVRTPRLGATLAELRDAGLRIVGLGAAGRGDMRALHDPQPTVIVLGAERAGLSFEVTSLCDAIVRIPGSGHVESLNVSVAAGIALASRMLPTA